MSADPFPEVTRLRDLAFDYGEEGWESCAARSGVNFHDAEQAVRDADARARREERARAATWLREQARAEDSHPAGDGELLRYLALGLEAAQPDAEQATPRSELRRIAAVEGVCPICAARPVPAPDNPQAEDADANA